MVTGGAGFVGSHLCERLLAEGHRVVCVDNFSTGRAENIAHLLDHPGFRFSLQDVTEGLNVPGRVDAVYHLASPASPADYLRLPVETLLVGSYGTRNALELARRDGARFLLTSTSEVYGSPQVHPQPESYWGNVNPVGPRSVYDEAKRFGEAITMAYHRTHGVRTTIVRIFNTYGPRMRADDGRAVPAFVTQALAGEPLTVTGDGGQTRSMCYVDDLVDGLRRALDSGHAGPVNLGNPVEVTMRELALTVSDLCGSASELTLVPRPQDDPQQRRPDITAAREELGWVPRTSLEDGLRRTVAWFRDSAADTGLPADHEEAASALAA
ncbi:UDP-glucuronic acid decarboxylase family protein [Streptomyces antarcticus]|uniref:UDP-glucuronic acid decarboxylase family protein n=1 Tax=Streptomyces antarcticus TaxID=2996458 RepID=UPI00226EDD07|nr:MULTISPECIES: UDP-glucuronic acid decarboxylase family protein [unclassified Streptomyces]MCY0942950.1 SDR family oxidoreductase [Streptomyces sp. H34-AA3]MCY0953003.1 SDR family oxidoreductase [Streptomyces sp. H27-S2]MCZ4083090.1 SDR family oxidoreductase [Streptomyces sp. H34-S5]